MEIDLENGRVVIGIGCFEIAENQEICFWSNNFKNIIFPKGYQISKYVFLISSETQKMHYELEQLVKVEKILKCSMDLIPSSSPSVKTQIMGTFA